MKKIIKKSVVFALTLAMVFSLFGCGKKDDSVSSTEAETETKVSIPTHYYNIQGIGFEIAKDWYFYQTSDSTFSGAIGSDGTFTIGVEKKITSAGVTDDNRGGYLSGMVDGIVSAGISVSDQKNTKICGYDAVEADGSYPDTGYNVRYVGIITEKGEINFMVFMKPDSTRNWDDEIKAYEQSINQTEVASTPVYNKKTVDFFEYGTIEIPEEWQSTDSGNKDVITFNIMEDGTVSGMVGFYFDPGYDGDNMDSMAKWAVEEAFNGINISGYERTKETSKSIRCEGIFDSSNGAPMMIEVISVGNGYVLLEGATLRKSDYLICKDVFEKISSSYGK